LILLFSHGSNASALNQFTYYTEDYPPYNYLDDQTVKGLAVDLLLEANRHIGSHLERSDLKLLPWPRAYYIAQTKPNSVLFSTARIPAREKLFKWAGPIGATRVVILAKKQNSIIINQPSDLSEYSIGVVKNDIAEQLLLEAGVTSTMLEYANTSTPLSKMLSYDRFKLWAYEERAARIAIEQSGMNNDDFEVVYVLQALELYYAFHPDTDDKTITLFQAALDALKKPTSDSTSSYYETLLHRYNIID